jgi:hypothetical protein
VNWKKFIALPKTSDLIMGLMRVDPEVVAGEKGLSRQNLGRGHARRARIKADRPYTARWNFEVGEDFTPHWVTQKV